MNLDDKFKICSIPGKGRGMIAERDIEIGELIVSEDAIVIVEAEVIRDPNMLEAEIEKQLKEEGKRETFMALSDFREEMRGRKTSLGIFYSNCVALGTSAESKVGIVPLISRVNHACVANAEVVWREEIQQKQLRGMQVWHAKTLKTEEKLCPLSKEEEGFLGK